MSVASRHMDRVARTGCSLCAKIGLPYDGPVDVHHIYDVPDRSDYLTIGLCFEHHRGANGFHLLGERAFNARYKTSETKLLAWTLEQIAKQQG